MRSHRNTLGLLLVTLFLLAAPLCVQASVLTGDTVGVTYYFPDSSSVYGDYGTVTAPGTFFGISNGDFNLVVNDSSIVVPSFTNCDGCGWAYAPFNGFVFTDYSNSPITSVTVDSSTTMPLFSEENISWSANQIWVNWQGLQLDGGVKLDINGGGGAVPEPATWLLLGSALAGLATWRKRRARLLSV